MSKMFRGWILVNRVCVTGYGDIPLLWSLSDTKKEAIDRWADYGRGQCPKNIVAVKCRMVWSLT